MKRMVLAVEGLKHDYENEEDFENKNIESKQKWKKKIESFGILIERK